MANLGAEVPAASVAQDVEMDHVTTAMEKASLEEFLNVPKASPP